MSRRPNQPPPVPRGRGRGRGGKRSSLRVPPAPPKSPNRPPRPPAVNRGSRGPQQMRPARGRGRGIQPPRPPPGRPKPIQTRSTHPHGSRGPSPIAQVPGAPAVPDRNKRSRITQAYVSDVESRIAAWYAYQAWYSQHAAWYAAQQQYAEQQYYGQQQQPSYGYSGRQQPAFAPAVPVRHEETLDEELPTPATPVDSSPLVVTPPEKIPPPRPSRKPALRKAVRKVVAGVRAAKALSGKVGGGGRGRGRGQRGSGRMNFRGKAGVFRRGVEGPARFDPAVFRSMFHNPQWYRIFEYLPVQDLFLRIGLTCRKLHTLVFSVDMYRKLCLRRIDASASRARSAGGPVGVRRAVPRIHSRIQEMAERPNVSIDRWKEVFAQLCLCFRGSSILSLQQMTTLNRLSNMPEAEWRLLYQASRDGWASADFHKKCDFKEKTMTVIKTPNGSVFGGFTPCKWSVNETFQGDEKSFLFSLVTPRRSDRPCRMDCDGPFFNSYNSIWCAEGHGPCFGELDIVIYDHPNERSDNFTHLGYSYSMDGFELGSKKIKEYLTGSYNFTVSEMEVFQTV